MTEIKKGDVFERFVKLGLSEEDARLGTKYLEDTKGEDGLAKVIRAHLYLESSLNLLIEESLVEPSEMEIDRLSFPLKIGLALALNALPQDLKQPMLAVNSLRNRLAHDIEAKITPSDADRLYKSFSKAHRKETSSDPTLGSILAYLYGCLHGLVVVAKSKREKEEG